MSDDQRDSLLANLQSDDQQTREDAIRALGDPAYKGDAAVIQALAKAALDNAESARAYRLRQFAAQALGVVGDSSAVQSLTFALEDENSMVKTSAAESLGKIGDAAALPALLIALKDKNADVRQTAILALSAIDSAQASAFIPLLGDPEDSVRKTAAEAIAAQGANALKSLVDALQDPNSTIRGAAAELLGRLKDERAREGLNYVAKQDKSEWVKGRAKWALEQLPPAVFVPPQIKRGIAPPPPSDTLRLMREQAPETPSLRPKTQPLPAAPVMPIAPPAPSATSDPSTMSAEQVQVILDQLDVRLTKGEISEATYHRLAERWEARLNELRGKSG